ncbi:MAG: metal ABC transporter ATP-binding protein [Planctomycetota bacterium]
MNDIDVASSDIAIQSRHLTVTYGERPVLWNIDIAIPRKGITGIIGPNGAGKSTLIKAMLGIVPIASGTVAMCDRNGRTLSGDAIGYVPQRSTVDWDFPTSVFDVVMMGTYGKLRWFQRPGKSERVATQRALEFVEMQDFATRQISELSGGQQQRVFLARAFVQKPSIYLMDEPFAGVDTKTERSLLEIFRKLRDDGSTVVMVHHDLLRAHDYFDHVILLNRRLIAQGPTKRTLTESNVETCYGVSHHMLTTSVDVDRDFHTAAV